MSGVKFKVTGVKLGNTTNKLLRSAEKAETTVAMEVLKDTDPYVPMRYGALSQTARVNGNEVIYPAPYARYLYYGKLMVDPDTGSAWASKGASKVLTGKDLDIKKNKHSKAQSHWFEASKAQNKEKWVRVAAKTVGEEIG
jgi:hypothetical protein